MSLDDLKRRILARVPLEALLAEHGVALKHQSGHWVGKCCFHADSTPSLHVYADNHYHCFGCKAHGDAITFVRETQGLGYVEALRYLAGKHGVEAPELDQPRAASREAPLFRILQETQEFFVRNLWSPAGDEARAYLRQRGYDDEAARSYGFGLTPLEGYGLVKHLRHKGYRESDMILASVATAAADQRRTYDFFRQRLMIPIHDAQGRLIAFGGRTLDNNPAKYVNSRETPLFQKSQVLFGFDKARAAMRQRGRAIVVEGYMDTLMLRRHGFAETVGILGTAINLDHLKAIERATSLCYLLLDADAAGQSTTLDAVTIAMAVPRLEIRAVRLPDAKQDPDEFVRERGVDGLEELLRDSRELFAFAIAERFRQTPSLAVPELVTREFVPWLAHVADPLKREILAGRIAQLTGVGIDRVLPAVNDARRDLARQSRQGARRDARADDRQDGQRNEPGDERRDLRHHVQDTADGIAAPTTVAVPIRPLPAADVEAFGHIYHAQPTELDADAVEREALRELELDLPYQDLLAEMLAALRRGTAPASLALLDYPSSSVPAVAALVERLAAEGRRFAGAGRAERVAKIFEQRRRQRQTQEMSRLRVHLTRLQLLSDPENDKEIQQILTSIAEMRRQLDRPAG